jgi:hypothetical protein
MGTAATTAKLQMPARLASVMQIVVSWPNLWANTVAVYPWTVTIIVLYRRTFGSRSIVENVGITLLRADARWLASLHKY